MPRYSYTARTGSGEKVASTADAASVPALASALAAEGTAIQTVRELHERVPRIRGVPYFEVINIYRQLASSIEAGLPLYEALEMLSCESRNTRLKSLLYFLKAQIADGIAINEAMKQFPEIFPAVHVAVVKAGEESGKLSEALADLADQAESFSNMNRRFASALVYPVVISIAALALFSGAFIGIIPQFKALFGDLGIVEYSVVTRLVFFIAGTVLPVVVMLLIGILILIAMITTQRKAATGKMWIDRWKLRIPLLGQIIEKASLARFSGTLGLLLDAGIELPKAIRLASEGTGNKTVEHLLKNVSNEVELGQTLSDSIDKSGVMPSTLAWRVGVGEETGTLPDALIKLSQLYAKQVDSLVTSLAGMIEPLLIIFIGTGVAMLVLGMFLPLVAIINNLSGFTG